MTIRQITVLSALIISIAVLLCMAYFETEILAVMIPLAIVAVIGAGSLTADVIKNKRQGEKENS
ncbi:hypothetical protein SAMN05421781_0438 [Marinococcus luteus]|uniref:Uncharacterized protein n=1 Tax=Marinococcus luteus TaxID=1122204 RepID=A0A1H2QRN5_9BACI|nr:hypothetical protein [Marinococcus luteus]SDW09857.1 hypothetical protein SAMN05421781_0438 [Marinococcus luteus]